jgi:hypothetical protein
MPHLCKRPVHTQFILCYEGDDDAAAAAAAAAAKAKADADAAAAAAGGGDDDKRFTQADLNKFLAEDKRKHQEKFNALEGSYKELLKNQNLTKEERDSLQTRLEDLQASHRTKEQQAEHDRKKAEQKYSSELETERKRADHWESMFKTNEVQRALQDAAVGADAFNPGHIVALLAPNTQLKEDEAGNLSPMVDFVDIDEKTGEEVRTLRTPADAVKRMRELPKFHGNLFRSNVVSGVGAGQATTGDDTIDYANLSAEDYRKNREAIKKRLAR